ncbi:hypothetical protein C8R45DRAFT_1086639 [Mycena sanguinolenta]|nr:hypothetical protein C8R45DRAFT_1086639 [Mycena sanguinolenta]
MAAPLRRRLLQLDAQIAEQKRHLHELQQTRSDVERELNATATFPVSTLPPEILGEIFISLLAVCPSCIPKREGEILVPVVLASVCRQCKNIAFATSILWFRQTVHSCIHFTAWSLLRRDGNCPCFQFHRPPRGHNQRSPVESHLAQKGLDIYLGTEENYLAVGDAT